MGNKRKIQNMIPALILMVLSLGSWAYAVFYHMDNIGAIISAIAFILYGISIGIVETEDENGK